MLRSILTHLPSLHPPLQTSFKSLLPTPLTKSHRITPKNLTPFFQARRTFVKSTNKNKKAAELKATVQNLEDRLSSSEFSEGTPSPPKKSPKIKRKP